MPGMAIRLDTFTPRMRRLAGRIQGRGRSDAFLRVWGGRVRKEAQERALAKGGRRFWRDVARSVTLIRDTGGVQVAARHRAAAQKQYGGTIRAKGKGAGGADHLTIPIADEAEGQSAAKFTEAGFDLFALGLEDDNIGALGYADDSGEFVALFALVTETREQAPDPFFPTPREVADMGEEEAVLFLRT